MLFTSWNLIYHRFNKFFFFFNKNGGQTWESVEDYHAIFQLINSQGLLNTEPEPTLSLMSLVLLEPLPIRREGYERPKEFNWWCVRPATIRKVKSNFCNSYLFSVKQYFLSFVEKTRSILNFWENFPLGYRRKIDLYLSQHRTTFKLL